MISTQSQKQQIEKIPTPTEQGFDYATLNPETRNVVQQHTSLIRTLMRRTAQDTINIGQNLIEVKEQLGHGQFRNWLKAEFNWSVRTAARFMQVATKFKDANLAHLDIAVSALYLLAEPCTPDEAQEEALELAKQDENINYTKAKDIINQHKEAQMLTPSKPDIAIIPAETMRAGVSTSTASLPVVQTVENQSTAVVKPFEEQLPEEKEALSHLQVSNCYDNLVSTANGGDYLSQDRAKIKVQSLLEIGHHICIADVEQQDHKWIGEVAEVKEATATNIEVVIKITL